MTTPSADSPSTTSSHSPLITREAAVEPVSVTEAVSNVQTNGQHIVSPPVTPAPKPDLRTRLPILLCFSTFFLAAAYLYYTTSRTIRYAIPQWSGGGKINAVEQQHAPAATIASIEDTYDHYGMQVLKHRSQRLSFTLLNELGSDDADTVAAVYRWDFPCFQQRYLQPMLSKLYPIIDWTTDSQQAYYASLLPPTQKPQQVTNDDGAVSYFIHTDQLKNFVGTTQWNSISPLVSSSIEVLIYIPSPQYQPLYVKDGDVLSNTFIVPRWGVVHIANVKQTAALADSPSASPWVDLSDDQLHAVAESVVGQLRAIIGLTGQVQSAATQQTTGNSHVTDHEYQHLLTHHYIYNYRAFNRTYNSLQELLVDVPQMPVNEHVSQLVYQAIAAIDLSTKGLDGSEVSIETWQMSTALCSYGRHLIDTAFFDSSMLPALYFPDEHLYAVYFPLFLPITIPILSAWIKLVKESRAAAKQKLA